MFDADPLGDGAVHPPVYVSCDAGDGPARHAYLRLKHRRSVHDDDLAFRLRIDGKLNPIINQLGFSNQAQVMRHLSAGIVCSLFWRL